MLTENEIFNQKYRIIKFVGHGGMGTVYLSIDISNQTKWAIKEQLITEQNKKILLSEAEIMEKVSHPAFPKFHSKIELNGFLYIIMEYVEGVTLEKIIEKEGVIEEAKVIDWFKQACVALQYLHGLETPIVYRDFKPSNIMLDVKGRIRIIDLGIAQEYRGNGAKAEVAVLTRGYAAPEQYNKRYKLDERTDIYALAVTMHYLITGKDPNKPPYEFGPTRKLRKDTSRAIEHILKKCLQPNPDKRYANARLLLSDLNKIDELQRRLALRVKKQRVITASTLGLIIAVATIIYTINLNIQTKSIEKYYSYLEQATGANTLEEAQAAVLMAIDMSPENPDAYIAYASLYIDYDDIDDAYAYINDVIIIKFPEIYSNQNFLSLLQKIEDYQ